MEPSVSVPMASAQRFAETPTADPELDPQGVRVKRREDVHNAPAHGKIARLLHNRGPQVTAGDQLRDQLFAVDLLTGQDQFGIPADLLPRDQTLQQRLDRHHHDGRHIVRQHPIKNPYALGGRLVVVGNEFERKLVVGREKKNRNSLILINILYLKKNLVLSLP